MSEPGIDVASPLTALENTSNFANKTYLGDYTSCSGLNAIEPSFTRGGNQGNPSLLVYGVYIAESSSSLPSAYGSRGGDMLEFISGHVPYSGGNVSSAIFSTPVVISSAGNLALPQIKSIGSTLYVVYENIANSSTPISGGYLPISVMFTSSTDGGKTWSTPAVLTGQGASQGFNAMSPSISVSSLGTVAVAYATNRACDSYLSVKPVNCLHYGSSVVVVTSVNNGTTWSSPSVVATNVTESMCYSSTCQAYFFQATPETAIVFSPNGTRLFVAWAGAINASNILPTHSSLWYRWTGVGVAQSQNFISATPTWTGGLVRFAHPNQAPVGYGNSTNYFRPALGVDGVTSQVYLAFSVDNETQSNVAYSGPWDNSLSEWVTNAPVLASGTALTWGRAAPVSVLTISAGINTNATRNSFSGYRSSIAFTSAGVPLIGFSISQLPTSVTVSRAGYYSISTTYGTNLSLGMLASYGEVTATGAALVTNVTFSESGLPIGATWDFEIDNQIVSASAASLVLTDVPKGVSTYPALIPYGGGGYGYSATVSTTAATTQVFNAPTTVTDTYAVWVLSNIFMQPSVSIGSGVNPCGSSSTYCYIEPETFEDYYWCNPVYPVGPTVEAYVSSFTGGSECYYSYYESNPPNATMTGYCDYLAQVGCEFIEAEVFDFDEWNSGTLIDFEVVSLAYIEMYCDSSLIPQSQGCYNEGSHEGYGYIENENETYGTPSNPNYYCYAQTSGSAFVDPAPSGTCSNWFQLSMPMNVVGSSYTYNMLPAYTYAATITYANSTSPGGYSGSTTNWCPNATSSGTRLPGHAIRVLLLLGLRRLLRVT